MFHVKHETLLIRAASFQQERRGWGEDTLLLAYFGPNADIGRHSPTAAPDTPSADGHKKPRDHSFQ